MNMIFGMFHDGYEGTNIVRVHPEATKKRNAVQLDPTDDVS